MIRILFGETWLQSVPILRILCLHAILIYTTVLVDQMLISSGRIRSSFRIILTLQIITVIAVLATAVHGLTWVAAAMATVGLLQVCIYQIAGQRLLQIPFASFSRIYIKNIVITVVTVAPSVVVMMTWGNAPFTSIPTVAAIVLATGFSWLLAIWLLKAPLLEELAIASSSFRAWRRPGTSETTRP
jgi:O-antigen/teichoic acid export membrane protein